MMKPERIKKIFEADRRLVFLKLLAAEPDYSQNKYVIKEALAALGHSVSSDQIETDGAWLDEQGLITLVMPNPGLAIYRITERGLDVSRGRAAVPGVKRPEPGLDY